MEILEIKKTPKKRHFFCCKICDFNCSKKSDYERHLSTDKHKWKQNGNEKAPKNAMLITCDCGKEYKTKSGLWKHYKKCSIKQQNCSLEEPKLHENGVKYDEVVETHNTDNSGLNKDLVMNILKQNSELIKENNDFKMMMMDVIKTGTHHTTNNHNKTFNLNLFLNETCKNAMNIMDFVNSLQLQLSDLENMGDVGYVTGISNIIIKNLKDMDVNERPVHCTDKKREILYVKDDGIWNKEDDDKPKIRKAIKHVAHKNALLLQEFKEKYPDCMNSESKHSDAYNKIIIEAMGGKDYEENNQEQKIIRKITKEITIGNNKLDIIPDN